MMIIFLTTTERTMPNNVIIGSELAYGPPEGSFILLLKVHNGMSDTDIPSNGELAGWRKQANEVLPPQNERETKFHGFYSWDIYDGEDVLGAVMDFFSRPHHAMFIRVEDNDDGCGWVATGDPYNRLDDIYRMYDCPLTPVELPGIDGLWMMVIHPFGY